MVDRPSQQLLIRKAHVNAIRQGVPFSELVQYRLIEYVSAEEEEYCEGKNDLSFIL